MTEYPEPRRVVLALADTRRLTILERARACAIAGVAEKQIAGLLLAVAGDDASPEQIELGATLLYALAWQLERRLDPAVSWAEAQTWSLALDLTGPPDPVAEAEARASVEAALATGLSPAVAGELSLAQVEAYGSIRREAAARPRHRVRRR